MYGVAFSSNSMLNTAMKRITSAFLGIATLFLLSAPSFADVIYTFGANYSSPSGPRFTFSYTYPAFFPFSDLSLVPGTPGFVCPNLSNNIICAGAGFSDSVTITSYFDLLDPSGVSTTVSASGTFPFSDLVTFGSYTAVDNPTATLTVAPVIPEPATVALFGLSIPFLLSWFKNRRPRE